MDPRAPIRAVAVLTIGLIVTTLAVQFAVVGTLVAPPTHFIPEACVVLVQSAAIILLLRKRAT